MERGLQQKPKQRGVGRWRLREILGLVGRVPEKSHYKAVIRHCENVDTSKVKKEQDVRGGKDEMM